MSIKSFLKKTFENIFLGIVSLAVIITYPWYEKAKCEADEAERGNCRYEKV